MGDKGEPKGESTPEEGSAPAAAAAAEAEAEGEGGARLQACGGPPLRVARAAASVI